MSPAKLSRYRVTLVELLPDGTTKERFQGDCDAYLLAVVAAIRGELRAFTDHDGPAQQRRTALDALTTHVKATIGRSKLR